MYLKTSFRTPKIKTLSRLQQILVTQTSPYCTLIYCLTHWGVTQNQKIVIKQNRTQNHRTWIANQNQESKKDKKPIESSMLGWKLLVSPGFQSVLCSLFWSIDLFTLFCPHLISTLSYYQFYRIFWKDCNIKLQVINLYNMVENSSKGCWKKNFKGRLCF